MVQLHQPSHPSSGTNLYCRTRGGSQVFAPYPCTKTAFFSLKRLYYRLWPGWTACKESLCGFKRLYCKGWLDLSSPSFFVPKRTGSVLTLYIDETISFPFSALIWIRVKNVRSCWNPCSGFLLLLLLLVCLSFFFSSFFA